MGCGCNRRSKTKYVWSDGAGNEIVYNTEVEAKAKVLRKGGSYTPREG